MSGTSTIADLLQVLTCSDPLTDLSTTVIRFIKRTKALLEVMYLKKYSYILNYFTTYVKNKTEQPMEVLTLSELIKRSNNEEEKCNDNYNDSYNKKTEKFYLALKAALLELNLQSLIDDSYKSAYLIILKEFEETLFNSQREMITEILLILLNSLQTFYLSFLSTANIFNSLNCFLSKLLFIFSNVTEKEFKEKHLQQVFITDILLMHKTCPHVHTTVYRDISIYLEQLFEIRTKLTLIQIDQCQYYVLILTEYLSCVLENPNNFDDLDVNIFDKIKHSLMFLIDALPEYARKPHHNVLFLIKEFYQQLIR